MASQELCMLVPASVPWWPRHDWDSWLQRNTITEAAGREFDVKLDVTPETNDTSSSEVAPVHRALGVTSGVATASVLCVFMLGVFAVALSLLLRGLLYPDSLLREL